MTIHADTGQGDSVLRPVCYIRLDRKDDLHRDSQKGAKKAARSEADDLLAQTSREDRKRQGQAWRTLTVARGTQQT